MAFNSGKVDKYDGKKINKGNGSVYVTTFCRHIPR
jgi:ribosomal protein L24E